MNKDKAVDYIERCRNYDGGFGSSVGAESHSAQGIFNFFLSPMFFFLWSVLVNHFTNPLLYSIRVRGCSCHFGPIRCDRCGYFSLVVSGTTAA